MPYSMPSSASGGGVLLAEAFKGPVSRASSCEACRKAKTRCAPTTPKAPPFPCGRCTRLKLVCRDPHRKASKRPSSGSSSSSSSSSTAVAHNLLEDFFKGMAKRIEAATPPVDPDRVQIILTTLALVYRRLLCKPAAERALRDREKSLSGLIKTLARALSMDADDYVRQLAPLQHYPGLPFEGYFLSHHGSREQAMHPYCSALLKESAAAIVLSAVGGEIRWFCNEEFSSVWFTEAEADVWYNKEQIPASVILAMPIDCCDKSRLIRTLIELLVDAPMPGVEKTQIFKVRLPKQRVTVVAMTRFRFMLSPNGEYMCAALSFSPLPIHSDTAKRAPQAARRSTLLCPMSSSPWLEAAQAFGQWDDEQDMHRHLKAAPVLTAASSPTTPWAQPLVNAFSGDCRMPPVFVEEKPAPSAAGPAYGGPSPAAPSVWHQSCSVPSPMVVVASGPSVPSAPPSSATTAAAVASSSSSSTATTAAFLSLTEITVEPLMADKATLLPTEDLTLLSELLWP